MNRRTFFSWTTFALGAALWRPHTRHDTYAELTSALYALFSAPSEAIALGRRYLALHPAMAARELLLRDLDIASNCRCLGSPLAGVVSAVRDRDFRDGNIVVVDGWMLARSEIAVCALLALA